MKPIAPARALSCALSSAQFGAQFGALFGALAALIACGPAPEPAAPTAGVTSDPALSGGATAGPGPSGAATPSSTPAPNAGESPSAAPDAAPSAQITEVAGEPGKTAYMKVTAVFANPGARPCRISRYTLEWPGGTKEIQLDDFVIPAKESRQRSVKVHPDNGDLTKLSKESARMALPAKCEAP